MSKLPVSLLCLAIVATLSDMEARAEAVGSEAPKDILSAQVRVQGYTCEKALGATRDSKRSRPDHDVWTLKCSNATFRVSRAPDMMAKITVLP